MKVDLVLLTSTSLDVGYDLPLGTNSVAEMFSLVKSRLSDIQASALVPPTDQSERAAAAVCIAFQLRDQIRWRAFGTLYRSHGLGTLESQYFSHLIYARTTKDRLTVSSAFMNYYGLEIHGDNVFVLYRPHFG